MRICNLTQSLNPLRWRWLPVLLVFLLSSCVIAPPPGGPGQAEIIDLTDTANLEQLAAEGRFLDAALGYSKLASAARLPDGKASAQHAFYSLRTAELLMQGNYVPQAFQLLSEIDLNALAPELLPRHTVLSAEIALARNMPEQALTTLEQATDIDLLRLHRLRAKAFAQLGNHLESTRERVLLEPLLADDEDAVLANQEAILASLQMLSPAALQSLQTSGPPDVLSGWLELTQLGHRMSDSRQPGADVVTWRERYPAHPAKDEIIAAVLLARPRVLPLPKKIALILPLNKRFANAASAVRDGFLAAYFSQTDRSQTDSAQAGRPQSEGAQTSPTADNLSATPMTDAAFATAPMQFDTPASVVPDIAIYDAGEDPSNIGLVYEQAIDDGAEFVVGPLRKEAVKQLAGRDDLTVPVLALNYSGNAGSRAEKRPPENLFQLSLSPEQEAQQVAERAWLDGFSRAAIITPNSDWGQRVAKAFSERWLQFGGHVVEKQKYDAKKSDYSLPIRRLLNVDESEQRKNDLRYILGGKLEFIPRRRQDIDFIFMAASSRQARLIPPQLRFHHAPKVPVYATSHSYSGRIDADMDRDMDGVVFADMPWTLHTEESAHALKTEIEDIWPNASKRYSRLFALGVDAYRVIGELNNLRRNRSEFYPGETGDLYLDVNNRLQRRLLWARFDHGVPLPLDEFQATNQNLIQTDNQTAD